MLFVTVAWSNVIFEVQMIFNEITHALLKKESSFQSKIKYN